MRLADIRIGQKIALAFAVVILGAASAGFSVRTDMQAIEAARQASSVHNAIILATVEARGALSRQENSLRGFLITRDDYYDARVKKHAGTFADRLKAIGALAPSDTAMAERLDRIGHDAARWRTEIAETAIALARDPAKLAEAAALITSDAAGQAIDPVEEALDALRDSETAQIAEDLAAQGEAYASAQWTFLGSILGLVALSLGLAAALRRGIAKPILIFSAGMQRLASGDVSIAIPALGRKDEIGAMAAALDRLKQVSAEHHTLQTEAQHTQEAQRDRLQADAEMSEGYAKAHEFFMSEVQAGFNALSSGNLRARLEKPFSSDYEMMRSLFNESVAKLEQAFAQVVQSVGAIRTGLAEISVASNDLSQRTEQQAASLEETVAALADVTRGINETASGAGRAQGAASTAQTNAEKGGAIVGRAIEAMSHIEQSSQKIGKIVGVIDEIAFQTNLLALNAGVEAARAGEAGRGFAVVAQEVRGLAQRSAEAAKEIKSLISASSAQVAEGVQLVTASGQSLGEIVAQVGEMNEVVSQIARSAREQAISLKEVSTAADQMDKVTQQNAAMVEETTAAAQHLATETEELSRLTDRFVVGTAEPAAAAKRPVPAARRPAASATSTARPAATQLRSTGRGGAAPAANTQADGWEEF